MFRALSKFAKTSCVFGALALAVPSLNENFDQSISGRYIPEDKQVHRWSTLTKVGFRFAFCYLMLYCLCNGDSTAWGVLPYIGDYITEWLAYPFVMGGQYLAQHLFHVQGPGSHIHETISGDTAIAWIADGIMLVLAFVGAVLWNVFDWRRPHYQTLSAWLRFTIRLTLGITMIWFGFIKLFPRQMQLPGIAILNEPVGHMSPMSMVWTMIGMSPAYESICGAAEIAAALLILFRRTALAGAILTAFVTVNVMLYNFFFDVPVKLFATHLLIMALFVVLPDVQPLIDFFWRHKQSAPTGVWVPPANRPLFRRMTVAIEGLFLLSCLLTVLYEEIPLYRKQVAAQKEKTPLRGGWRLDGMEKPAGTDVNAVLMGNGLPMTELYIDTLIRGSVRSSDGALWRASITPDRSTQTLQISIRGINSLKYAATLPDIDHLVLTPPGKDAAKEPLLRFTRIPLETTYPLMTRGFHWVNEWGLER